MKIFIDVDFIKYPTAYINNAASSILDEVSNGYETALDARKLAVIMAKISEAILADETCKHQAINEARRLGKDNTLNGAKYTVSEVGTKYDYSKSDAWLFINDQLQKKAIQLKNIETICKHLEKPAEIEIEGAIIEVVPAIKSSSTTVKIELL